VELIDAPPASDDLALMALLVFVIACAVTLLVLWLIDR
jgi:hypothetical protein